MINFSSLKSIINSSWAQPLIGCFCIPNHPIVYPEKVNSFNTNSTKNCIGESSPTEVEYSFTIRTEQANKLTLGVDNTMKSLSNKLKESSLTLEESLSRSERKYKQSFLDKNSPQFYQNNMLYQQSLKFGYNMNQPVGLRDNEDSESEDDTHYVSYPIRPVVGYSLPIDIP